jgi:hypothetical protein
MNLQEWQDLFFELAHDYDFKINLLRTITKKNSRNEIEQNSIEIVYSRNDCSNDSKTTYNPNNFTIGFHCTHSQQKKILNITETINEIFFTHYEFEHGIINDDSTINADVKYLFALWVQTPRFPLCCFNKRYKKTLKLNTI